MLSILGLAGIEPAAPRPPPGLPAATETGVASLWGGAGWGAGSGGPCPGRVHLWEGWALFPEEGPAEPWVAGRGYIWDTLGPSQPCGDPLRPWADAGSGGPGGTRGGATDPRWVWEWAFVWPQVLLSPVGVGAWVFLGGWEPRGGQWRGRAPSGTPERQRVQDLGVAGPVGSPLWGGAGGPGRWQGWGGDILQRVGATGMVGHLDPGVCRLPCSSAPETEAPGLQGLVID